MFIPGTRVMVASSSITKKRKDIIGPKLGSIGYTSSCIDSINSGDFKTIVCPVDIFFVRYGFEKKGRLEKKTVLAIFPTDSVLNEKDLSRFVADFLSKNKNFHHQMRKYINSNAGKEVIKDNTPTVLLAKHPSFKSLQTCENEEFEAWFNSILCDRKLFTFLSNITSRLRKTRIYDTVSEEDIMRVWAAMNDKSRRDTITRLIAEGSHSRDPWISRIRVLLSVYFRRMKKLNDHYQSVNIPFITEKDIHTNSDACFAGLLRMFSNTLYFPSENKIGAIKFTPKYMQKWAAECLTKIEKEIAFIENFTTKVVESRALSTGF